MTGVIIVTVFLVAAGYFAGVSWSTLGIAVLRTTYRLIVAYGIALVLGTTIALLVGWSSLIDALFPFFDILQNVPSFALVPFFIYFFGTSDEMIIILAASCIIWPIIFAIIGVIKNAHKDLGDAAAIFGANGLRRVVYYLTPLSFPAILTGSMIGVASGWEAVIGTEIIVNSGFGSFIKTADVSGVSQSAIAGMLVILVIVFIINRLIWAPLLAESGKLYAE